jgi:hypothetical protein
MGPIVSVMSGMQMRVAARSVNLLLGLIFSLMSDVRAETSASPGLQCDSETTGGDIRSFTCPLPAAKKSRRFRFKANFAGGHDDTTASMTVALNEMPLVCEQGSKTSLMAEDGNVSLECIFSTAGKPAADLKLQVLLKWSHAQYTDFEFRAE